MTQTFLIPIIIVSLTVFPFIVYYYARGFVRDALSAETTYTKVLNWIGFSSASILFLISGTVVGSFWITLFTGGTITAP